MVPGEMRTKIRAPSGPTSQSGGCEFVFYFLQHKVARKEGVPISGRFCTRVREMQGDGTRRCSGAPSISRGSILWTMDPTRTTDMATHPGSGSRRPLGVGPWGHDVDIGASRTCLLGCASEAMPFRAVEFWRASAPEVWYRAHVEYVLSRVVRVPEAG